MEFLRYCERWILDMDTAAAAMHMLSLAYLNARLQFGWHGVTRTVGSAGKFWDGLGY